MLKKNEVYHTNVFYTYTLRFWLFFVGSSFAVFSQNYPVQVSPQLMQPYGLVLSEYGQGSGGKIMVNLLLADLNASSIQVRLKISLENTSGVLLTSKENTIGSSPIFLDGGALVRLDSDDLAPYFSYENINGISPNQYNTQLPEGVYRFCFEVFDQLTGKRLSAKSCATAYLKLNDPPVLNIPANGEQVSIKEKQNIIFQWTPRHMSTSQVVYDFELVELWDKNLDPEYGFTLGSPVYYGTVSSTTIVLREEEVVLSPNSSYAWRVTVKQANGFDSTNTFKNNGHSEIFNFTYSKGCEAPKFIVTESRSGKSERIVWEKASDHEDYNIQYRNKSAPNSEWFDITTYNNQVILQQLEAATTYQYRVGGRCGTGKDSYTYSSIYEFTTLEVNNSTTYSCGIRPSINITNKEPLSVLVVNDVFRVADFEVVVKGVTQGNISPSDLGMSIDQPKGVFSGWGYVNIPYIGDSRIKVKFENVKLNSDYDLYDGFVHSSFNPNTDGIDDIGDDVGDLLADNNEESPLYDDTNVDDDQNSTTSDTGNDHDNQDILDSSEESNVSGNNESYNIQDNNVDISNDNMDTNNNNSQTDLSIGDDNVDSLGDQNEIGTDEVSLSYLNTEYSNGAIIPVKFSQNSFNLKNVPEDSSVIWEISSNKVSNILEESALYTTSGIQDEYLTADILNQIANYKEIKEITAINEFDGKVLYKANLEAEKFELTGVYVRDKLAPARKAYWGETLYMVKHDEVEAKVMAKSKTSTFTSPFLKWETRTQLSSNESEKNVEAHLYENSFSKEYSSYAWPMLSGKRTHSITAKNLLNGQQYGVTIKTMKSNKRSITVPPSSFYNLGVKMNSIITGVTKVKKALDVFGKGSIKIRVKPLANQGLAWNQEDPSSRFYQEVKEYKLKGGIELTSKDFTFNPGPLKFLKEMGVADVGIYLRALMGVTLAGEHGWVHTISPEKLVEEYGRAHFYTKGCVEAGVKAELLVAQEYIDLELKGYASSCIYGDIFYYPKTNKFDGGISVKPLIVGVKAKAVSKGYFDWTLLDYEGKISLFDPIKIY